MNEDQFAPRTVTATIVRAWIDNTHSNLSVRVESDAIDHQGNPVAAEYIGSVSLDQIAGLTTAQHRALLLAAVQSARARAKASIVGTDIAGITGQVQV